MMFVILFLYTCKKATWEESFCGATTKNHAFYWRDILNSLTLAKEWQWQRLGMRQPIFYLKTSSLFDEMSKGCSWTLESLPFATILEHWVVFWLLLVDRLSTRAIIPEKTWSCLLTTMSVAKRRSARAHQQAVWQVKQQKSGVHRIGRQVRWIGQCY